MIVKDPEVRAAVNRLEQIAHESAGPDVAQIARSTNLRQALRDREERAKSWWNRAIRYAKRTPHNLLGYTEEPTPNDQVLSREICRLLESPPPYGYPGWEWLVGVKDGIVRIHSTKLDSNQGYVLHADKLEPYDELVRQVREAGGEILERYGMPRKPFDTETYLARRRFMLMQRGGLRLAYDQ